jgi:hypothetical protein
MFIANLNQADQAPLGAACNLAQSREPDMRLLAELEISPAEPRGYKHDAPKGAIPSAQE